jgi:hypothetical protein
MAPAMFCQSARKSSCDNHLKIGGEEKWRRRYRENVACRRHLKWFVTRSEGVLTMKGVKRK